MNYQLNLHDSESLRMNMLTNQEVPSQLGLLLVDDEEFNLKALKRTLYNQGFTIFTARSGQEALETLRNHDIAIVVTDMRMPHMGGADLLRIVRDEWPNTQRIVLTGYTDPGDAIDVFNQCGVYRYITKPWDDEYLLSTIHEAAAIYWGGVMDRIFELNTKEETEQLRDSNRRLMHSFEQSQAQLTKLNEKLRHSYEGEKQLRQERREAQRLSDAKSRFLATISHEIRTPLNSIIATNSLLLESQLNSEQKDLVQLSLSGAQNLLTLMNDILDFSKINAGRLDLHEDWFSIVECVESICELLSGNLMEKAVDLAIIIEPGTPTEMYGDRTRVSQIITNLLSNAIKFTDEGSVTVSLTYSDSFHISVKDTGPGIPEDQLAHIFEEFTQVDNSSTRSKGGSGLGLSISKKLCQLMGGSLTVSSRPKRGSCFTANLPLSSNNPMAFPQFSEGRPRCLLLSHNQGIYEALKIQLSAFQCDLELGESFNPNYVDQFDAILYDTDSVCVVHVLESEQHGKSKAKHVALIRNDGIDKSEQMRKRGFDSVLRKPIRISSLCRHFVYQLPFQLDDGELNSEQQELIQLWLRDSANSQADVETYDLQGAKILLAEDSPSNQAVIKSILKNMNVSVDIANNGNEAVLMAEENPYDVVLMDIRMPNKDGLTAAQEITSGNGINRKTPIIALTANAYSEDQKACISAGMVDFLSKPINVAAFRECVSQWSQVARARSMPAKPVEVEPPVTFAEKVDIASQTLEVDDEGDLVDHRIIRQLERDTSAEVLPQILDIFYNETRERLLTMQQAYKDQNWDALETDAHTLKSSAGSFGALQLQGVAKEIESQVRAKNTVSISPLIQSLPKLVDRTLEQMTAFCS